MVFIPGQIKNLFLYLDEWDYTFNNNFLTLKKEKIFLEFLKEIP